MKILNQLKLTTFILGIAVLNSVNAQEITSNTIDPKLNSPIPTTSPASRANYVLQFDSSITTSLEVTTNQWYDKHRLYHTYHPNGNLHTETTFFLDEKNVSTYDLDGKQILFERFQTNGSLWDPVQQSDYYYNQNDQLFEVIINVYNQGQWIPFNNYKITYNSNGEIEEELYQTFDGVVWKNSSRNTYSYDLQGNLDTLSNYQFTPSGVQYNLQRSVNTYNSQGIRVENAYYQGSNNSWIPVSRYKNTYNGNQQITLDLRYSGNGTTWVLEDSTVYTYNSSNFTSLEEVYSNANGTWIKTRIDNVTLNSDNEETQRIGQILKNGVFENEYKTENIFNSNNLRTKYISYVWDSASMNWHNQIKYEYSEFIQNVATETSSFIGQGTGWQENQKHVFIVDMDVLETEINGYPFTGAHPFKLDKHEIYGLVNGTLSLMESITNYYSDITTHIFNTHKIDFKLFPNPCANQLQLQFPEFSSGTLRVLNLTGQVQKEIPFNGISKMVDVSDLPNGNYILQVAQEGNLQSQPFIKF